MTMDMAGIINQLITLFLIMAVGYIANKTGLLTDELSRGFSKLVLCVTMPALLLSSVINVKSDKSTLDILALLGITLIVYAILIAVGFLMPVILRAKPQQVGVYRFMTIFTNAGFMGFPVITAIYGEEALFYAMLFQLPFNILVNSLGAWLVAGKNARFTLRQLLLKPGSLAAVAAVIIYLLQIPFPTVIEGTVDLVGQITTPASMLIIGATLGAMPIKQMFNKFRLYPFALLTNVLLPLALFFLLRLFVTDQTMLQVAVVIVAMPVATTSTMLCHRYGGDADTASAGVFLTTALSVATIPLVVWLMQLFA